MVRAVLTRSVLYEIAGRLLISAGIILGFFLGARLGRDAVERQIVQQSSYLLIASTPMFELPPATPHPTMTPTPSPTALPPPLPAIRLSIPAIQLNTSIQEISAIEKLLPAGGITSVWEPIANAAGHYDSSGNPGGGRNIVFSGHNNTLGEIFRDLNQLQPEDEVILFTEETEFHYQVQKKYILPYLGVEETTDLKLQAYAAPQSTEMVTLISCWPYATNSNRIVIVAVPVPQ